MWVLKSHGVTFYVNHVSAEIPWSTKETPDNPSTKGSLKFKQCKLTIDADNNATLSKLTLLDRLLPHPTNAKTRIITDNGGTFHQALKLDELAHSTIKYVVGGCGSDFVICDLLDKDEVLLAAIKYPGKFRILKPNEPYYQKYDRDASHIYEDDEDGD